MKHVAPILAFIGMCAVIYALLEFGFRQSEAQDESLRVTVSPQIGCWRRAAEVGSEATSLVTCECTQPVSM
jgi:hypothetical protein